MQLTVTQIWDLDQARCRFGKYLRVAVNGKAPDVARLVREFPAKIETTEQGDLIRGLAVRLAVHRPKVNAGSGNDAVSDSVGAVAELQLGEAAKFFPTDAALAGWRAQADQGRSVIVYE